MQTTIPWRHSIRFRVYFGFSLLLLLLTAIVIGVVWFKSAPRLTAQAERLSVQASLVLRTELARQLTAVEMLTVNLAQLWSVLPKDAALYQQVMPVLIDRHGDQAIAGGGIWPEPNAFQPGVARRSFFWAREDNGQLAFLDDYNDPAGDGYHRDDWYIAGRGAPTDRCVWSPAYTDPHSREPMVTCTVPLVAPRFAGVATIDLSLGGLAAFFAEHGKVTGGYALLIDQSGQFLVPPRTLSPRGGADFVTVADLERQLPAWQPLFRALSRSNDQPTTLRLDHDPVFDEAMSVTVTQMPETGWRLVLLTPRSLVAAEARGLMGQLLLYLIPPILLLTVLGLWLSKRILLAIANTTATIRAMSQGRSALAQRLPAKTPDEIGALQQAVNQYADFFQELIRTMSTQAQELSAEAAQLTQLSNGLSHQAELQREQNQQLIAAVSNMASGAEEVTRRIHQTNQTTADSQSTVQNGHDIVTATGDSIRSQAQAMEHASRVIQKLSNDSQEVGAILNVIKGIANQTNLLALNAAIEAARAGEQGRGFAVVADEVRSLAVKSQESAKEIDGIVAQLLAASSEAVEVIETGHSKMDSSLQQAEEASGALDSIAAAFKAIAQLATDIAEAAEQQEGVAREVTSSVQQRMHNSQSSDQDAEQVRASGQRIAQLAQQLEQIAAGH